MRHHDGAGEGLLLALQRFPQRLGELGRAWAVARVDLQRAHDRRRGVLGARACVDLRRGRWVRALDRHLAGRQCVSRASKRAGLYDDEVPTSMTPDLQGKLVHCVSACIDRREHAWSTFRAQLRTEKSDLSQSLPQGGTSAEMAFSLVQAVNARDEWPYLIRNLLAQFQMLAHDAEFLAVLREIALEDIDALLAGARRRQKNPYRHLYSFEREHALIYSPPFALPVGFLSSIDKFIALIGPSGCGKSSLARAYIIPRLDPCRSMHVIDVTALEKSFDDQICGIFAALGQSVPQDETMTLAKAVEEYLTANLTSSEVLLFFDQFEAIIEMATAKQLHFLLDSIVGAINSEKCRIRIVLTMRADASAAYKAHEKFHSLLGRSSFRPEFLDFDQLRSAIRLPAMSVGVEFEDALIDKLVDDFGGQVHMLPFLQVTLFRLFERAHRQASQTSNIVMSRSLYGDNYDLRSAIRVHLKEVLEKPELARFVTEHLPPLFAQLVERVSRDRPPMRRRASCSKLRNNPLFSVLCEHRVLIVRDGPLDEATAELAHDVLFETWGELADWIAAMGRHLDTRVRIERSFERWISEGRPSGRLLSWTDIEDAQRLPTGFVIDDRIVEYISKSTRKRHWQIGLLAGFGIALLATIVFLIRLQKAAEGFEDAERRGSRRTLADRLSYNSHNLMLRNLPSSGLHHAIMISELADADPMVTAVAKQALLDGLFAVAPQKVIPNGSSGTTNLVQISHDGRTVVFGTHTSVRSYDVDTGKIRTLTDEQRGDGGLATLAISADDQRILAVFDRAGALVMDRRGHEIELIHTPKPSVAGSFAPHSSEEILIIAGCEPSFQFFDGGDSLECMSVWDLREDRSPVRILQEPASDAVYSPLGLRIVSAAKLPSSGVRLRSSSGTREETLFESRQDGMKFMISPDGEHIVIYVYDLSRKNNEWHLYMKSLGSNSAPIEMGGYELGSGQDSRPTAFEFSPDGARFFVGFSGGELWSWPIGALSSPFPLPGHGGAVYRIFVSDNGRRVYSAGVDKVIHRMDLKSSELLRYSGHDRTVRSLVVAPHEDFFVSGSPHDGSVRIWRREAPSIPTPLLPDAEQRKIRSVAISASGDEVALGVDGAIYLLDPRQSSEPRTFPVLANARRLNYSNTGDHLLAVDEKGSLLRSSSRGEDLEVYAPLMSGAGQDRVRVLDARVEGGRTDVILSDGRWLRGVVSGGQFVSSDEAQLASDRGIERPQSYDARVYPSCNSALLISRINGVFLVPWQGAPSRLGESDGDAALSGDCRTYFVSTRNGIVARPVSGLSPDSWALTLRIPRDEEVETFTVSSDGEHVVGITVSGAAYYWDLRLSSLLKRACDIAGEPRHDTRETFKIGLDRRLCPLGG